MTDKPRLTFSELLVFEESTDSPYLTVSNEVGDELGELWPVNLVLTGPAVDPVMRADGWRANTADGIHVGLETNRFAAADRLLIALG